MLGNIGETFTLDRPAFYLITFIVICNFVYVVFFKDKLSPINYIIINSLFFVLIGAYLTFQSGIIVAELNLSGDSLTLILLIVSGLFLLLSVLYKKD